MACLSRNVLAKEGLVQKYVYGWSGLSPTFQKLAEAKRLEAYNLPLGVGTCRACSSSMTISLRTDMVMHLISQAGWTEAHPFLS